MKRKELLLLRTISSFESQHFVLRANISVPPIPLLSIVSRRSVKSFPAERGTISL